MKRYQVLLSSFPQCNIMHTRCLNRNSCTLVSLFSYPISQSSGNSAVHKKCRYVKMSFPIKKKSDVWLCWCRWRLVWVWVFQKLLISWEFYSQQSLTLTQNCAKMQCVAVFWAKLPCWREWLDWFWNWLRKAIVTQISHLCNCSGSESLSNH